MVDRVCTSPDRVWTLTVVCKDENRMILYCIPAFYDPGDEGRQAWGFRCRFGQEGGGDGPMKQVIRREDREECCASWIQRSIRDMDSSHQV